MMSIGIIVNGTTYTFDNATYGYCTATDGFGMPPIDRFSQRGAQQHGSTDLGYRLQTRRVSLVIVLPADTESAFFEARNRLLKLFHPDNQIILKVTDGAALERRLDVVFESSMDMPLDREWRTQNIAITLRTSSLPAWYDPTARSALIDAGGGSGSFTVPMPVPHHVGSSEVRANAVIQYYGSWQEYPRVRITGPINDCVITNNATGEKLDFTGFNLADGHYLDVDPSYGKKTVLYDGVTNYIDKLTSDSDLATFSLAPAQVGEVYHENSFSLAGDGANASTKIQIYWNDRFIGI